MNVHALKGIAKIGYAARGIVYFLVGGFAVLAAVGSGGGATDTKGALLKLFGTGYGAALLVVVAVGLLCYAIWRFLQSLTDADHHGTSVKGLVVRTGLLVSSVTHVALALWAFAAAWEGGGRGGGENSDFVAWLMQQPYGQWLVFGIGLCVVGAGVAHLHKGATKGFEKWFAAEERKMRFIRPVSTIGLIARGVVFLLIGGLFVYAGLTIDPQKAGGLDDALEWVRGLPVGVVLFFVIAIGLVCFGAYSLLEAFYRRINTSANLAQMPEAIAGGS